MKCYYMKYLYINLNNLLLYNELNEQGLFYLI